MVQGITKEEFREIITKFAESGWDLIAEPAKDWLNGTGNRADLLAAVTQAQAECGSCGCEFDPLYAAILQAENY